MTDDLGSDDAPAQSDRHDAAQALAVEVNEVLDGKEFSVILQALSLTTATLLRAVSAEPDDLPLNTAFAAFVVSTHAGIDDAPPAHVATAMMTGEADVTPAQIRAATALCPLLSALMSGLLEHYETRYVVNAWFSVLLNVLLGGGVEPAQAVLRETADALPATVDRMEALRRLSDGANVSDVGRA